MGWATLLATFSRTHLITLFKSQKCSFIRALRRFIKSTPGANIVVTMLGEICQYSAKN
jgi:hypothetical protein